MTSGVQGITESDIASYLANTPAFFERHADLLASIQLVSPHGQRAVSLQERQMEMLREKIHGLEQRIIEMIRHAQDNAAIADRLYRWTRTIMLESDANVLPARLIDELQRSFLIPRAAIRVWGAAPAFADQAFAAPPSDDVKRFADAIALPYCGASIGLDAVQWLDEPETVASMAAIALRGGIANDGAFGLIVLGSPDPTRFSVDMGTDFLVRIGELASAGLQRLLPAPAA